MTAEAAKIRCSQCGIEVRKWEVWEDSCTGEIVYRVFCHGEIDECRVDWRRCDPKQIVDSVAFSAATLLTRS